MSWFFWSSSPPSPPSPPSQPSPPSPPHIEKLINDKTRPRRIPINKSKQESIWIRTYGEIYRVNCYVCDRNTITPFNSVVAHKQAFSLGGGNNLDNLIHICSQCNSGMYNNNLEDYKKEINNT